MRKSSKNMILLEAFKLFAYSTYEQVTYSELEKSTKLSRGALLYHFKTKEDLFRSVCDQFLIQVSSMMKKQEEKITEKTSLKEFIDLYIQIINEIKEFYKELGLKNINKAFINITNQATYYYPNFEVKILKWQVMQIQLWSSVLKHAIKKGELKKDIDIELLSELFEDLYCGIAYSGKAYPEGIEVERLKNEFGFIYNLIKQ